MKAILLTTTFFCLCFQISQAQWTDGTNIPEGIRAGNTVSHIENDTGYIYLMGGRNGNDILSLKNYRYNLNDDSWETMADVPTETLGSSGVKIDDDIYIIGGGVPGGATKKVQKYSIPTNSWSQVADFPIIHSDGDAVKYQDSLIYVVGSYYTEKTYVYNKNTDNWREGTSVPSPGFALTYGGLSVYGNKLVYVGGSNGTFSGTYWNTVWIGEINQNDRSQITWTEGTPFPGETRTFFEFQPWENGLILIGGTTDNTFETFTDENYFYNVDADSWHELSPKPTAWNTGNAASIIIDGEWKLICAGGYAVQYLLNTEIYSQEPLAVNDFLPNDCNLENFKILNDSVQSLNFCILEDGNVNITISDGQGRIVNALQDVVKSAGIHSISLDRLNIAKGVYFCTLSQNGISKTKKMLVSN